MELTVITQRLISVPLERVELVVVLCGHLSNFTSGNTINGSSESASCDLFYLSTSSSEVICHFLFLKISFFEKLCDVVVFVSDVQ